MANDVLLNNTFDSPWTFFHCIEEKTGGIKYFMRKPLNCENKVAQEACKILLEMGVTYVVPEKQGAQIKAISITIEDYENHIYKKIQNVSAKVMSPNEAKFQSTLMEFSNYTSQELPSASELKLTQKQWLDIYWHKLGEENGKSLTEMEKAWNVSSQSDPNGWGSESWESWMD